MAPLLPRQTTTGSPSATAAPPTDFTNIDARADIYGGSHNGLTNGQIGAIIGSVIGFTLLVLALIFCAINKRRAKRQRHRHRYHYDRSSSGSSTSGGSSYRGRPVRTPPAARVRRNVTVVDRDAPGAWEGAHWGKSGRERVRENIPGGPKWPTYNAIPIPNPRKNPNLRRQL